MDQETFKAIENYRGFGEKDSLVIGFEDGQNGSPTALMVKNEFPKSTTNMSFYKKKRYHYKKENLSRSTTNLLISQRPITAQ